MHVLFMHGKTTTWKNDAIDLKTFLLEFFDQADEVARKRNLYVFVKIKHHHHIPGFSSNFTLLIENLMTDAETRVFNVIYSGLNGYLAGVK